MKYNLFIVVSPLHVLNSIEMVEYLNSKRNILVVLSTKNDKTLKQMQKIVDFIDWHRIWYIPLPFKKIDKVLFVKRVHDILKDIDKSSIENIIVGEFRSDHVNHIVNYFSNKNIFLVDDGLAQVNYHTIVNSRPTLKESVRHIAYRLMGYQLTPLKYKFFTIFDIKNEQVIKNEYTFFKKKLQNKVVEAAVYFIGQPLVELSIMNEIDYKHELSKIIDLYGSKRFIYVAHRRESHDKVEKIAKELGFEFREFNHLLEVEMILSKSIPSDFATFFSSAIVTLPYFIKKAHYRVFKSENRLIRDEFLQSIQESYEAFEAIGLKVEML